jgi:hypothetical protein
MAKKYKVLEKSFIHNTVVEAGEVVEYDGTPGPNLEPWDGKSKPAPDKDPPIV